MNIINNEKLGALLASNWTTFLDHKRLMACVLMIVRDYEFPTATSDKVITNTNIKVSNLNITKKGFILWIEFNIPNNESYVSGTTELLIDFNGEIDHIQTIGQRFSKSLDT